MIWMQLLACAGLVSDPVTGRVRIGPYDGEGPLAGGTVTLLDHEGAFLDSTTTAGDGAFEVTGPRGRPVAAVIEGEGMVPAGFAGVIGNGPLAVPDGEFFSWPLDAHERLMRRFDGCSEPGEVVHGEVRLFGATDENGDSPLITTAFAWLVHEDGDLTPACYLDEAGLRYDPEAVVTGQSGQFAFFDVDPGYHQLLFGYSITEDISTEAEVRIYVPEGGIAPLFPAWADLIGQ